MHKLLARQIARLQRGSPDGSIDHERLLAMVSETYEESDRERRIATHANQLMQQELFEANRRIQEAAEQHAKTMEARLLSAIGSISDGFALFDAEDRLILCNDRFVELYREAADVVKPGCTFAEILYRLQQQGAYAGADTDPDASWVEQRLQSHQQAAGEPLLESWSNGRWLSSVEHVTPDGGIVGIYNDITASRLLDLELRRAKLMAEEGNRAKSEFLANMSHEIRTPMNAIIGLSHLALRGTMSDQQRDYLMKIQSSAHALLGIINDILDFSKIEAGHMALESIQFSLGEVIEQVVALIRQRAAEKGIELLIHLDHGVPDRLVGDPLRLGQVLTNLATNAVKFTHVGEVVVGVNALTCDAHRVTLEFTVRDTGIGMTTEQLGRLFQSFSQADTSTTRQYGGTGLGLTICKRLVEMMDGRMSVDSSPGSGSVFRFMLDLEWVPAVESERPSIDLAGRHLLIVDDSETARTVLEEMALEFGMRTTTVADAETALAILQQAVHHDPFDLALVDWRMPGMDGLQMIDAAVSRKLLPPTVLVTAYDQDDARQAAGNLPIADIMVKPVTPSIFFDAMAGIFFQSQGHAAARRSPVALTESVVDPEHAARLRALRVLLVEDNPINQQVARELLADVVGDIVVADNGRQALAMLDATADAVMFDLVLMDVQMPEMDGYQATREIRLQERFVRLPVIAMTAHAMVGDRERCLQAGMNDHLTKPIVPQRLYEMIERWGLGAVSGGVVRDTAGVTATERERFRVLQPAIDVDQAWRNINGRGALLETMLLEFVRRFDGVADRMREELARQALDEMQRQAHTLKGVAATLGANAVATVSGRIETILRQRPGDMVPDQLDGPDGPDVTMWEPLLSELAREMALVRDRVADWQQKATPVDPDPGATASAGRTGTLDRAALMPLLREIDRMLNDGDATVTDRLPALERCLRSWCPPEDILMQALRQVCDHAANFDFDEAVIVFADVTAALEERPA